MWYRVTRNSQEFRRLTGCQWDPWVLGHHKKRNPYSCIPNGDEKNEKMKNNRKKKNKKKRKKKGKETYLLKLEGAPWESFEPELRRESKVS